MGNKKPLHFLLIEIKSIYDSDIHLSDFLRFFCASNADLMQSLKMGLGQIFSLI